MPIALTWVNFWSDNEMAGHDRQLDFGVPVQYKTQNSTIEGGYNAKTWNVKLQFLDSKFNNSVDSMQWSNFFMLVALRAAVFSACGRVARRCRHLSIPLRR